ncbi:metal ABC transporter permease [Actinocatenispora comari]|uniref:High-affinity zinc uptake system membrane protein ZnuB n=1 Tax=Actinocatenispora comari TaxID=2807577 RepID=A0A8J4A5Q0_9ACTN|nr:metal ABC transporter permease [Actinocatenispora comari]GIL25366.1 ABC transporter permease [Actinocatenispora comari]
MTTLVTMFSHAYLWEAFLAGTFVALAAGLVGYLLVLRAQVFTADALSHVSFTGAFAALALGLDLRVGLFAMTIMVGLGMAAAGRRAKPDDVVIGGAFAWILGLGVLLLTIYTTRRSAGNGAASVTVLFGSVFGLSRSRALTAAAIALGICLIIAVIARPLIFASLDETVAAVRGVPVRLLGFGFLALTGVAAAEATQVVGSLLILGLVAAPAGAAARLVANPYRALPASGALAVLSVWAGLTIAYLVPVLPPSFAILAVATVLLLAAMATGRLRHRTRRGPRAAGTGPEHGRADRPAAAQPG